MAGQCSIADEVKDAWKKITSSKSEAAIRCMHIQVNRAKKEIFLKEYYEDTPIEEIAEEDFEDNVPSFLVIRYRWERKDGSMRLPVILVHHRPEGGNPYLNMMTASMKQPLIDWFKPNFSWAVSDAEEIEKGYIEENLK
mmetsp:Transcript_9374/g.13871  ORF Transcript_9374/g.13871 Transcript_9374/m.13871 type:complete len:139 (+) Transcript_9374:10-426(+)